MLQDREQQPHQLTGIHVLKEPGSPARRSGGLGPDWIFGDLFGLNQATLETPPDMMNDLVTTVAF